MLRVAWYRFRATWRDRWAGYLALVLLIGTVGGLALGAIAGARRTQSSFPRFLRSTHPSDLVALTGTGGFNGYDQALLRKIGHLPQVTHAAHAAGLVTAILDQNTPANADVDSTGSVDGLRFTQDRVTVTRGRMANPKRAGDVMMTADAARSLRLHLGEVAHFGVFSAAQFTQNTFGPNVTPYRRFTGTLVGIVVYNDAVVQDDADRTSGHVLFTPALTRPLTRCCPFGAVSGLQLRRGSRDVAAVETEIQRLLPAGTFDGFHDTSTINTQVERAIKPEAIALGVFGAIAALAALLIALQVIGQQLRRGADALDVLRALGASPTMTASEGLVGILASVVIGSLLAGAIAVGVSPLAPLGPVRTVDPFPGIAFDWTVLGAGVLVLLVVLGAGAVALANRGTPHRVARRRPRTERGSRAARAAAASGLPVETVTGIRFALEPGRGRNTVPVRSAMFGAVLAMIVLIGTVAFGDSLHTLVSHPQLYGWNWDYELLSSNGGGSNIPDPPASRLLSRDPDVAASAGVSFVTMRIGGQTVPVLAGHAGAAVGPRLLTGHRVETSSQIVVGASTLAQLHKHVGDTVDVRFGARAPSRVRIVGTATMPTIGPAGSLPV
ncbi:MAG TPA: hypothetical protein VHP57_00220, partial [Acidimicrobiia bacterium]|nr:hypothetical protein [Acidimicrobiia bacterium]